MAIIQAQGSGFELLIQSLMNKQRLEQASEAHKLDKDKFKLEQEKFQAQQQQEQLASQQASSRLNQLFQAVTRGGPGAEQAMQSLTQSGALGAAQTGKADVIQQMQQTLGRREAPGQPSQIEVTQADVEQKALLDRIGEAGSRLRRSVEVAQAGGGATAQAEALKPGTADANFTATELQNEARRLANSRDPRLLPLLNAFLGSEGALSWSEMKSAGGIISDDNIPDDFRMPSPAIPVNSTVAKAKVFLPLMKKTNDTINGLSDAGVVISLPSTFAQGSKGATRAALIAFFQDPRQKAMVQANRAFADMYRFSLSGQQSGEAERLAMMLSITEQANDGPLVIAQKRDLRATMIATQEAVVNGGMTALEAAEAGLVVARQSGNAETIASFEEARDAVIEDGPSVLPGDGNKTNDELINAALRAAGILPNG